MNLIAWIIGKNLRRAFCGAYVVTAVGHLGMYINIGCAAVALI
jgi:hypothetical protein